jgi:starvation-inducible outer membrane lipoprotein
MLPIVRAGLLTTCLLLEACGPFSLFPANVLKDVDTGFDFNAWRASPNANQGRKVQIGGRIIQAEPTAEGVLIVGEQLPIVEHPVYGPATPKKRFGVYEYAFLYPGKMEPTALLPGNRFIVVGTTQKARVVSVEGASKSEPYLIADCVHIWKTGEKDISDFPEVGAGYYPLESDTYCVKK